MELLVSAEKLFILFATNVHGETIPEDWAAALIETLSVYTEISIICYLRRQGFWMESFYNEYPFAMEKEGLSFSEICEVFGPPRYLEQLDMWRVLVGKDNIIVRNYERDRFPGKDIIADFANIIGISRDDIVTPPKNALSTNISIPRDVDEFLRQYLRKNNGNPPFNKTELRSVIKQVSEIWNKNYLTPSSWMMRFTAESKN